MTSVVPVEDDIPFSNTIECKEKGANSDGYHVKNGHEEEQDGASAHQDQARGPPLLGGGPTAGPEGEDRETTALAVEASTALEKDSAVSGAIDGRTQADRDTIEGRIAGEEDDTYRSEEGEEEEERTSGGRTGPENSSSRKLLQRTASGESPASANSRQSSMSEPVREDLYGGNGDDLFGAEDGQEGSLGRQMDDYHDQTWPPMSSTEDMYTPDGKLVVGRRVVYADEVGENMDFVAFSENLHYSRRNMDYVEDGQYREGGCCVIT